MHIMVISSVISIQSFSVRLSRRDGEEKQTSDKRSDDWMAVASIVLIGRKEHICISKKTTDKTNTKTNKKTKTKTKTNTNDRRFHRANRKKRAHLHFWCIKWQNGAFGPATHSPFDRWLDLMPELLMGKHFEFDWSVPHLLWLSPK